MTASFSHRKEQSDHSQHCRKNSTLTLTQFRSRAAVTVSAAIAEGARGPKLSGHPAITHAGAHRPVLGKVRVSDNGVG